MSKYLRHLSDEILDDHNLFVEFLLMWIGGLLFILALCAILSFFV
jgi:hypothetical protein